MNGIMADDQSASLLVNPTLSSTVNLSILCCTEVVVGVVGRPFVENNKKLPN